METKKKGKQGVCTVVSIPQTTLSVTKHTYDKEKDKKTPKHSLTFIWQQIPLAVQIKIGSVLLLIHKYTHTFIHTHTHGKHIHDAVHNMHKHRYNTYSFSLNALLCPQLSALKIGMCINKTLPSFVTERVHAYPAPLSSPRLTVEKIRGPCAIWLHPFPSNFLISASLS